MAPIPASMSAICIPKNGGVEVLEYKTTYPVPTLAKGEVLVRNSFAGVNYIDTYFRSGLYPAPSFPLGLGREAAGEVVAVEGDAPSGVTVGAKVVYMGGTTGAYAEYSSVPAENCIVIPEGVSEDVAAAVYLQGLTAWTLVRDAANVQAGQWTLVHAAAGGVGLLLVQMLSAVGAKVIATASSDEKLELAKSHGAGWGIKSSDDVVAKVKEITGGHGIDAIFDGVGKSTFDADLQMVAMAGWLISFGNASGAVEPLSILKLASKNVRLMRPVVNGFVAKREDLERNANQLFDLVKSGKLNVKVHEVYPLKDAARAHTDIESRKTTGKLLLKL
ncbi:hypothetical protein NLU13_5910 [Sarocladium strictum]|uniref:Probable quinone oxidoreductase n=1 Tax=Sarocladium strictum TaxID=5046 RepID=A0AA39L6L6_SARSR|nr:hypothetical protein NLU13_5910 [Sarocladium strictum]